MFGGFGIMSMPEYRDIKIRLEGNYRLFYYLF